MMRRTIVGLGLASLMSEWSNKAGRALAVPEVVAATLSVKDKPLSCEELEVVPGTTAAALSIAPVSEIYRSTRTTL